MLGAVGPTELVGRKEQVGSVSTAAGFPAARTAAIAKEQKRRTDLERDLTAQAASFDDFVLATDISLMA